MQVHHLNVEALLFYPSKKATVDQSVILFRIESLQRTEIKQNGRRFLQDRLKNRQFFTIKHSTTQVTNNSIEFMKKI